MDQKTSIQKLAGEFYPEIIRIRRHLHMHPELSFHEFETSRYIADILKKNQIRYDDGYVKTGIVAYIEGLKPGKKVVALRADLDALPIKEQNEIDYISQNPGVMHACGHDVHSASLLGTGLILNRIRDQFEGTVLLIFQPAEEKAPGGAKLMLQEGIFKDRKPDLMMAQHVIPGLPTGTVGFRSGKYMASSDEIYMILKGPGGHAAMPHQTADTVLIASHIIVALQQIVSRHAEASTPTVLSFGKLIADGAVNVIPSEVKIEGTFRTMDETWRKEALSRMKNMAHSISSSMGASCEFEIVEGYPVLENDHSVTSKTRNFAVEFLGEEKIEDLNIRMTAEDFAHFAKEYPSTFYRLGIQNTSKGISSELHSPTFNVDEESMLTGMGLMAYLTLRHLQEV